MELYGYLRENGDIGFRNNVLVLSTVVCAAETAKRISYGMEGVVTAAHVHGCGHLGEDLEMAKRVLANVGKNPNIAAVLIVGLGCENIIASELADEILKSGKIAKYINIQEAGGVEKTIQEGKRIIERLIRYSNEFKRVPVDFSNLTVGLNCGGSDTFSGLVANPSVGIASDLVVQAGGRVIISEMSEFIGAEHIMAKRAASQEIGDNVIKVVREFENRLLETKVDIRGVQPSPGNINAGLTTIEEKSLGSMTKCGSSKINQVVKYGERPIEKGVVVMDGPALDVICNTGMIASGAQIILFTTGLGNPVGSPAAPVVKLTGTKNTHNRLKDIIDISVHPIIDNKETIEAAGKRIFEYMVNVLNGNEMTKSERLGFQEFDFWRVTPNP